MNINILILFCFCFVFSSSIAELKDEKRNAAGLITSRGYKSEEHKIKTKDGYILTVFRCVNQYNNKTNKRVVFLQHGFGRTSDDFLMNSDGGLDVNHKYIENDGTVKNTCKLDGNKIPANTLGFVLCDCGYDVWLGNTRGNTYSNAHQTLKSNDPNGQFWKFSFQQMGQYDIPAVIDHILNQTKQKSLTIIAHSQGTTQVFAMMSENPEHDKKVDTFIALAPVVYFDNFDPLKNTRVLHHLITQTMIRAAAKRIHWATRALPKPLDQRKNNLQKIFTDALCKIHLCHFDVIGEHSLHNNKTRENVTNSHASVGSSWSVSHYAQEISSGRFEKFQYLAETPKEYKMDKINSSKIAIMYADKDELNNKESIQHLKNALQTNGRKLLADYFVPCKQWSHIDYVKGIDAGKCVNAEILRILIQTNKD